MTTQYKLLIVDDEEILRNCLQDVLTDEGFYVKTASTGEEGLSLFYEESFDILIVDMKMPGISGIDLLKTIKNTNSRAEVIIITGYASVSTALEAKKLGVFDYLTKPFDMSEIRNVIYKIIDNFSTSAP